MKQHGCGSLQGNIVCSGKSGLHLASPNSADDEAPATINGTPIAARAIWIMRCCARRTRRLGKLGTCRCPIGGPSPGRPGRRSGPASQRQRGCSDAYDWRYSGRAGRHAVSPRGQYPPMQYAAKVQRNSPAMRLRAGSLPAALAAAASIVGRTVESSLSDTLPDGGVRLTRAALPGLSQSESSKKSKATAGPLTPRLCVLKPVDGRLNAGEWTLRSLRCYSRLCRRGDPGRRCVTLYPYPGTPKRTAAGQVGRPARQGRSSTTRRLPLGVR